MNCVVIYTSLYDRKQIDVREQINGKTILRHVYESVIKCRSVDKIVVVSPSGEAIDLADSEGLHAVRSHTSDKWTNLSIAIEDNMRTAECVVLVNPNYPTLSHQGIDLMVDSIMQGSHLCSAYVHEYNPLQAALTHVTVTARGKAVYWSKRKHKGSRPHADMFAFRPAVASTIAKLKNSTLRQECKVEQMGWADVGVFCDMVKLQQMPLDITTQEGLATWQGKLIDKDVNI